jgi:hypothetical protein
MIQLDRLNSSGYSFLPESLKGLSRRSEVMPVSRCWKTYQADLNKPNTLGRNYGFDDSASFNDSRHSSAKRRANDPIRSSELR